MPDVFDYAPEITAKEKIIEQFGQWWNDEEIRSGVIPNIVGKRMRDSVNGALKRYSEKENRNSKGFTEILYDLVGQNFLVNPDKDIRTNFLRMILVKKDQMDPSFQGRFEKSLIVKKRAPRLGTCHKCGTRWMRVVIYTGRHLALQNRSVARTTDVLASSRGIRVFQRSQILHLRPLPGVCDNKGLHEVLQGYANRVWLSPRSDSQAGQGDKAASRNDKTPGKLCPAPRLSGKHRGQDNLHARAVQARDVTRASRTAYGAGKTRLVVETLVEWINRGRQRKKNHKFVVWIVDKNELCQQAFDTFADVFRHRGRKDSSLKLHPIYGDNAKNIGDILYRYSEPSGADQENDEEINDENGIIIGTIQSLYKMSKNEDEGHLPELGKHTSVVIIDEAHHAIPSNKSYNSVLRALGFSFVKASRGQDASKNGTCLIGLQPRRLGGARMAGVRMICSTGSAEKGGYSGRRFQTLPKRRRTYLQTPTYMSKRPRLKTNL